ncbi:Unknown protein [Striga hermonthica]|uniref:Chromatin modification-related protein MEAF6 n=1 Tax=Striga hermonthica TaxID=68872 RepID=A0A9N7MY66_STRHE|nr:Unknown protein [Striga hermonthica]
MELQGHRSSNNPKAVLSSLLNKREKLQNELKSVEKQVYELETSYLQETNTFGNAFKGFDGFVSSSKNTASIKRSKRFQLEDRVFSLSSATSPAAEELRVGKEDGKADTTQFRTKGGGSANAAQGKPKKGRTGQREVKKIRFTSNLDPEDEDDPDLR